MSMKIYVNTEGSKLQKYQLDVINEFIGFLQEKIPLKNDIKIYFMGERLGHMTTGARSDEHELKVLTHDRMLIDVLRTLCHEWTHEYEHEFLKMKFKQDIGGEAENLANIEAGIILKLFQKKFPQYVAIIYE